LFPAELTRRTDSDILFRGAQYAVRPSTERWMPWIVVPDGRLGHPGVRAAKCPFPQLLYAACPLGWQKAPLESDSIRPRYGRHPGLSAITVGVVRDWQLKPERRLALRFFCAIIDLHCRRIERTLRGLSTAKINRGADFALVPCDRELGR
jgi:hypothetical protein